MSISADHFFLPDDECPPLSPEVIEKLKTLTYPRLRDKQVSSNCPGCIDWQKFIGELQRAIHGDFDFVFVEGFLLFSKEENDENFDAAVKIVIPREESCLRKRIRSYSHPEISTEEFQIYFDSHVYPSYEQYGQRTPETCPLITVDGCEAMSDLAAKLWKDLQEIKRKTEV